MSTLLAKVRRHYSLADTTLQRTDVATIAGTYFSLAIGVSVIHIEAGTQPALVLVAAVMVNAATATLAFAAVAAGGGGFVASVSSGWLVSTRFGVLAATVAPMLWSGRTKRTAAAFAAFDPNVAMALAQPDPRAARRAFAVVSFWLVVPWWVGSAVGIVVGERIGDPSALGLDAMFPAVFIAVIWPQFRQRHHRTVGVVAAAVGLGLIEVLPGGAPVLLAGLVALWALRSARQRSARQRPASGPAEPDASEPQPC